ncbi:MAG: hypothetical protein M3406_06525 [Chloroflexota bacterium]|nr:hypothetical protein [Chloroflexota bacterium]
MRNRRAVRQATGAASGTRYVAHASSRARAALAVLLAAADRALPATVAAASLAVLPLAAVAVLRFTRIDSPTWAVATMWG